VPQSGEVLIRVAAAPVNPSDYGKWKRELRPDEEWTPVAIGNEGSGVVVASGGGWFANSLVDKKVGFINQSQGQGSYSEYIALPAMKCVFALPDPIPVEDAASFFVNPYTAYGIIDTLRSRGAKAFVHTGAASQVGQMLIQYCKTSATDVTLLNVVRREKQAATLRALGAEHVIVTAGDDVVWKRELKAQIKALKIHHAFDCVAGEMTEILLDALPKGSTVFVYGRLSGEAARVAPIDLIYNAKSIEGWLLFGAGNQAWLNLAKPVSTLVRLRAASQAVNGGLTDGGWSSTKFTDCTLDTMLERFLEMWNGSGFTDQKLRIRFHIGLRW